MILNQVFHKNNRRTIFFQFSIAAISIGALHERKCHFV